MALADDQRAFFLELYRQHGDDPRALSYRDSATQTERFRKAARTFEHERGPFRVHEVGCGLGHFGSYLARRFPSVQYSGSEICGEFVDACRRRLPACDFHLRDVSLAAPDERYDYVVLISVFNARLTRSDGEWFDFIRSMLRNTFAMAHKAITADFLTCYHDPGHTRRELHYQDEKPLTDFTVRELSRHFEIDHVGPLYEYNLRVWRPEHVAASYPGPEFERYLRGTPRTEP
jgi:cyclopropane fatty-acyl-phospholipid synthase-like methyltransferase